MSWTRKNPSRAGSVGLTLGHPNILDNGQRCDSCGGSSPLNSDKLVMYLYVDVFSERVALYNLYYMLR